MIGQKGRSLRVPMAYKQKVANIAAAGDGFKSCRAVVKGARMLGRPLPGIREKAANAWVAHLAYLYRSKLQDVCFINNLLVPIILIAWDATRLSSLDSLVSTIYSPFRELAGWCPPHAFSHSVCKYVCEACALR